MSIVILAEKPSQARDIANVLGAAGRRDGYIELRDGSTITWALGHLLETAQPEAYNAAWGERWNWGQLPMLPEQWKMEVVKRHAGQVKVIRGLLKAASLVVIATDAGREGELIARELLEHSRYRGPVKRFWTSSLVPSDIRKAWGALKDGADTWPLYEAALARQHADYLVGMNCSRAATLAAGVHREWFPVGRVQTPTLALVVRRDVAIRDFQSQTYYELEAKVKAAGGEFSMWHAPASDKRITRKDAADALLAKAKGAVGPLRVVTGPGKESPPMPYTLPALQKDANQLLGLTARRTLEVAQALYEQKKAISYPRTDCEYLAESQKGEVEATLAALATHFPEAVGTVNAAGCVLRSAIFNDAKLTDHHAIVPTQQPATLEGVELQVFSLVAQRYLQVLSPDALFDRTKVSFDANDVPFSATGKAYRQLGWRTIKLIP